MYSIIDLIYISIIYLFDFFFLHISFFGYSFDLLSYQTISCILSKYYSLIIIIRKRSFGRQFDNPDQELIIFDMLSYEFIIGSTRLCYFFVTSFFSECPSSATLTDFFETGHWKALKIRRCSLETLIPSFVESRQAHFVQVYFIICSIIYIAICYLLMK